MDVKRGINRVIWVLVFLILCNLQMYGQRNKLSNRITLHFNSVDLQNALTEIAKAGRFRFSYDAEIINGGKKVNVDVINTSVDKVLHELLGKTIVVKEVGSHVILVREKTTDDLIRKPNAFQVNGFVFSAKTRQKLPGTTIYEIEKRNSSLSGQDGYYQLLIPGGKSTRGLCFSKIGFKDTVIFVRETGPKEIVVLLQPLELAIGKLKPYGGSIEMNQIDSLGFIRWMVPKITMANSNNLRVYTNRTFQASIIPYLGTNWKMTGSITNRFSLNLIAGYTGGLNGLEVGIGMNITKHDVHGVQIGGLGNIVGGIGSGWQLGGLFNCNLNTVKGVQVSSLLNYGSDTLSGVQVVGLVNIIRRANNSLQVALLFNYARDVYGIQIGLINVSQTVERGVPIGLFSYVQNGYHLFEASGNEIFYGNLAFKSGTRSFYNFVQLGMGGDFKIQMSYGMGSIFTLKNKWSMNVDASAGFVYHPIDTIYHGLLLKFNPAIEYRVKKHLALFAGPAYNFFLFPKGDPSATSRGLSFYDFYFKSTDNASIQMWIGGVLGFRF